MSHMIEKDCPSGVWTALAKGMTSATIQLVGAYPVEVHVAKVAPTGTPHFILTHNSRLISLVNLNKQDTIFIRSMRENKIGSVTALIDKGTAL